MKRVRNFLTLFIQTAFVNLVYSSGFTGIFILKNFASILLILILKPKKYHFQPRTCEMTNLANNKRGGTLA